jgi:hypothetical protein
MMCAPMQVLRSPHGVPVFRHVMRGSLAGGTAVPDYAPPSYPPPQAGEGRVGGSIRATDHYIYAFFATGTGMPATFRLTDPSMVRLVKNRVFQSLPPKPMFVVAGWPWTMRPSFLPLGSRM